MVWRTYSNVPALLRAIVVCAVATGALAWSALPSGAVALSPRGSETDSLVVAGGILYTDICQDHPFTFHAAGPVGSDSWTMEVRAVGPFGNEQDVDFDFGAGELAAGQGALIFCGVEPPGAYTATATFVWTDTETGSVTNTEVSTTFEMTAPPSETALWAFNRTPRVGQTVKFRVETKDLGPDGYESSADSPVKLQMMRNGKWRQIRFAKCRTNDRGYGRIEVEVPFAGKLKVRAVTFDPRLQTSTSRPVKIRVHAG